MLPLPSQLLGKSQFNEWHSGQEDAIEAVYDWYRGPKRFMGLSAPTGSGKSLIAMASGRLSGGRVRVLTHTKGLQDQLISDFEPVGLVDIRGQNNYLCLHPEVQTTTYVDNAICHTGAFCPLQHGGCTYYDQLRRAQQSSLVVTNYPAWLNFEFHSGDRNKLEADLLICDEGSTAFSAMESFLQFHLSNTLLHELDIELPDAHSWEWEDWQRWFSHTSASQRDAKTWAEWARKRQLIIGSTRPWAVEYDGRTATFTPVWMSQYKDYLFGKTNKILLMSADLTPNDLYLLGITEDEMEWYDMPSTFPAENTPIYHLKTNRVHYKMDNDDKQYWASRIDQVIGNRPGRKGLILPVSYANQQYLGFHTKYRDRVVIHDRQNARQTISNFKGSTQPQVLISPSITTGYDFPGSQARFLIVAKVPWPMTQSAVFKSRQAEDKTYQHHVIAKTLVQSCGRGTRYPEDWCEIFVTDDTIGWWWKQHSHLTPAWFQERYQGTIDRIPQALDLET